MKLIPLNTQTKSKYPDAPTHAMVDDEDYEKLMQWNWYAYKSKKNNTFYARRNIQLQNGKQDCLQMHRFILQLSKENKMIVDHKDRNGVNNQKQNLRECSISQNNKNAKRKGTSIYAGVSFHKINQNWVAGISKNGDGKRVHLGSFKCEIDAAKAYDEAAKKYFGEFANLNFK